MNKRFWALDTVLAALAGACVLLCVALAAAQPRYLAVVAVVTFLFPQAGIFSVLAATIVFALSMCFLNAMSLRKYLGHKNDFRNDYLKPLAASAGMGVVAWVAYYGLHLLVPVRILCLGVAILLAVPVYLILFVKITGVTEEQMRRFPMGSYVVKVLRPLKIFG